MEINGKRFVLSPSKANLYLECKRCFWLDVNGLWKRPRAPFPSLPNGIDNVLKNHFDKYRENGGVPKEVEELGAQLYNGPEMDEWRAMFKGIRYEHPSGIEIMGMVDDMLQKDGKLIVFDFKTKGSAPHENSHKYYINQMGFYVYLLDKNGYDHENYAYLCFYYPEEVKENGDIVFGRKNVRVDVNPEQIDKLIYEIADCINGNPPLKHECEWCHWFSSKEPTEDEKTEIEEEKNLDNEVKEEITASVENRDRSKTGLASWTG